MLTAPLVEPLHPIPSRGDQHPPQDDERRIDAVDDDEGSSIESARAARVVYENIKLLTRASGRVIPDELNVPNRYLHS
jgi:hypothetical protein